jgi:zinc carboxypeptidase
MFSSRTTRPTWFVLMPLLVATAAANAQGRLTSPREYFGFTIGDDYRLATYTQFAEYWRRLDRESDRMRVVEIGRTAEGRPQLMAIVTSPANFARLDRLRDISRRLALADAVSPEEARVLAREGKAVVWIDGGLHATEVLGAHQLIETVYDLVSRDDEETRRILNDVVVLAVHANPDGMELVSSWYMREADTLKRNMNIPRLYQKYIGHDNNRDFFMSNQPETRNMNHVMYWEWFPQIVYNHHQTGPAGAVMFAPPFRDPFNYNYDPLVPVGIDAVGAAMHNRFAAEGKPGVTMRSGSSYSTWWNGGLRTTVYFHNMIGLLTETIGNPTPVTIPFIPEQQLPRADMYYPIDPQRWRFRQSIDYSLTANRAVLDFASRNREHLLHNIYVMGRRSIEKGSRDTWTTTPKDIAAVQAVIERQRAAAADTTAAASAPAVAGAGAVGDAIAQFGRGADVRYFRDVLRDPRQRDPRGYVIPADQPDFPTATKFVNTLRHVGVTVQRATRDFDVAGKRYGAGSYVVRTAQAFRPHVLDMFEPQDHPNDFAYPGGPPRRPYDNAGWTLAYQMGVRFDRVLDGFDCPCERIEGLATPPPRAVANASGAAGFLVSRAPNDAFLAVNRLLKAGAQVYWLRSPLTANGRTHPAGTFYVTAAGDAAQAVQRAATELGLRVEGTTAQPGTDAVRLRPRRIALWDQYGGSMPSGWTRWLLEQYEFQFEVVFPQQIDAGDLRARYDVIILPSGALGERARSGRGGQPQPADVPAEFRPMLGRLTTERSVPQLRRFLEAGGTVITVGSSTMLAEYLGLPVGNALVERTPTGGERVLSAEKFYVPGSVLQVAVDSTAPIATGMPSKLDVFFDNSPTFRLAPDAARRGVRAVAWFDSDSPLRSGWAWGQTYLEGGVAVAEATVGRGTLVLLGPEVTFRGQPHGTFKFLFNGIYVGTLGSGVAN